MMLLGNKWGPVLTWCHQQFCLPCATNVQDPDETRALSRSSARLDHPDFPFQSCTIRKLDSGFRRLEAFRQTKRRKVVDEISPAVLPLEESPDYDNLPERRIGRNNLHSSKRESDHPRLAEMWVFSSCLRSKYDENEFRFATNVIKRRL